MGRELNNCRQCEFCEKLYIKCHDMRYGEFPYFHCKKHDKITCSEEVCADGWLNKKSKTDWSITPERFEEAEEDLIKIMCFFAYYDRRPPERQI